MGKMKEVVLEYIITHCPDFAIVAIVIIASVCISRKFTKWEDRHERMHDELDRRTCEANCKSHESDINVLKGDLKDIKDDIVVIKSLLIVKHKNAADLFSMKKSPRRLNANGEKLFADINGMDFLQKNKDFLFAKIDEQSPKTALDVETAANFVCTANTDNDIFNGMKNFVYNSPSYTITDNDGVIREYDITLPDVCFVLSLPLRDMYLEAHKEIPE